MILRSPPTLPERASRASAVEDRPGSTCRAPNSADETADLGKSLLLVGDVGDYRLPNVHSVDGRISKNISYKRFNANFDVDIFNIFNSGTVLGRGYDLRLGNYNQVLEIMNPRIVRLGLRVGF